MRFKNLLICSLPLMFFSTLVYGNQPCILNADSKVTDIEECHVGAIQLGYTVKKVGFCPTLPSASNLNSCEFLIDDTFDFLLTSDSVTNVPINKDLPPGTYGWMLLEIAPQRTVTAKATFNREMKGHNGSLGRKCWTNGKTVNSATFDDDKTDNSTWTAQCGDEFPARIPSNTYIYNSFSTEKPFQSTRDGIDPNGKREVSYLINQSGDLATSSSEVSSSVYISALAAPVIVTSDPSKVGIFEFTYDRSQGAEVHIEGSSLPRIDTGTFTVVLDYSEITVD